MGRNEPLVGRDKNLVGRGESIEGIISGEGRDNFDAYIKDEYP